MTKAAADVYDMTRKFLAEGNLEGALQELERIFETNAADAAAVALAGDIFLARGNLAEAIGHYGLAVQMEPCNHEYKSQFIRVAGNTIFTQHNPGIEKILCLCFEDPGLECAHAQRLWSSTLECRPHFPDLFAAVLKNDSFDGIADLSPLLEPVFIMGLKRIVVCNMKFERFMTALRRFLLEQADAQTRRLPINQYLALIAAVSEYCFNTDYIFNRTAEEEAAVEKLKARLEGDPVAGQDPVNVGIYACYEFLHKLKTARDIAYSHAAGPLLEIIGSQLTAYFESRERAARVPSLTEITDETSLKVRQQYEEFPYPRWRELRRDTGVDIYSLNQTGPQVLIAGCGTGQEPLTFAEAHPEASVLAVDLSRASLSYAAGKAAQLGIKNVEFHHADILRLGTLGRQFDGISAIGSLVCMEDMVAGWLVLTQCLKPAGLMRIGLYSAPARRGVVTAWKAIREGNYGNTAAGMRRFRQYSPKLLGAALDDKIFKSMDYYHLNMYRDFLFHVKEHQSTLPQIKDILVELNLDFLGMSDMCVSTALRQKYKQLFPQDPVGGTLDHWHQIEEADPDTFTGMYMFWCKKRG